MATNIKTIFEVAEERDIEKGIKKGKIETEHHKNFEFTKNLLLDSDISIEKIALLVGVDVAFVQKVKTELGLGE